LLKTPDPCFGSAEEPDAKITGGKNAKEEEKKTAFGFELSPQSPHYTENYQPP